ncbi:MAG TPA: polysaccharide deacetylase [Bacteroidetes bacterium]|nr:polysaccharide deacetylase [Bacteroidota bacterium]
MMRLLLLAFALVATAACAQEPVAVEEGATGTPARTMAITIDDLPVGRGHSLAHQQRVTRDLLAQIASADVPVIGFVNEGKLHVDDQRDARVDLLRQWVAAGHPLGNHTYGHPSLFNTPLADYQADVIRGEPITRALLAERGDSLRYFRHPYLNTGPDLATKQAVESWLGGRGYTIAPVTHDNAEYLYALAYDEAAGDDSLRARIADAYLDYMDETAVYYEALSCQLFGREIAGILLLHANALNADHLGRLAARFRARGYAFTTLDEALEDPAYASEDTYAGRAGMSWLQRWAITRGVGLTPEPTPHDWILALTSS